MLCQNRVGVELKPERAEHTALGSSYKVVQFYTKQYDTK